MLFFSVFNNTAAPWASQSPESDDHECGNSVAVETGKQHKPSS